jgi:GntR family transcriptional regulator
MQNIKISKSEPLSVHVQLMEQLKYHIQAGTWEPGAQLPTVRELAQALRVNYNTVRAAYQELERQRYIVTEQGRGTFVAVNPPRPPETQQATLLDLVDEALIKAQAMGIPAKEFARTAYVRARLFHPPQADVRLLFSECNRADMEYYADSIQKGTGVQPEIFLLAELREREPEFFGQFDLITTTLFHVAEVQEMVGVERAVLGLMVKPGYLEVLLEIGRLPQGARVGLVCASQEGAEQMQRALRGVGMTHLKFSTAGADQPQQLEKVFRQAEQIYVSRLALRGHRGPWPEEKPVREYVDDLDPAALRLLRSQIAQIRTAKQADI